MKFSILREKDPKIKIFTSPLTLSTDPCTYSRTFTASGSPQEGLFSWFQLRKILPSTLKLVDQTTLLTGIVENLRVDKRVKERNIMLQIILAMEIARKVSSGQKQCCVLYYPVYRVSYSRRHIAMLTNFKSVT